MVNSAIYTNGPYQVDEHITSRGSDWLFAVCAIMGVSAIGIAAWARVRPQSERVFHYINIALLFTACIAYYTLGSNLGYAATNVEYQRGGKVAGVTRQIFYTRYIDWVVTTPLLLLDLLFTAGLNWSTIWFTLFLDEVMILTGLFGALTSSNYKWGYYAAGCLAFFGILYELLIVGRRNASALGADIGRSYTINTGWLIVLWFLYPICWGLAEGGNVITSDSEAIFYGVLDVLAKPVFAFLILWSHRNIDFNRFGLSGKDRFNVGTGPAGTHITTPATVAA